jgi:CheY-like chemotaxis protein
LQPQQPQNPTVTPSKKVLVIEDENFISDLYVRALNAGGYAPTVAIDGAEALKEAQSNMYDIILLDIMLPSITGTEILTTLRNPQLTPNLNSKIIITTNLELDPEGRAEIESQADGYIVKADITPKELVKFLDQLETTTAT